MLSKKMEKSLNDQIKAEIESAYLYLSMSAYFEHEDLPGMASWMRTQYDEEMIHAMKFYYYIIERGALVKVPGVAEQKQKWTSPLNAFKDTLGHEQSVTARINDLVEVASKEKDNATLALLQWYVNEQVEEESSAMKVIKQLQRVGDSGPGLLMVDAELGKRQPPSPLPAGGVPADQP